MSDDGYRLDLDPNLVEVTEALSRVMSEPGLVSKLGTDWRVVVERRGRPASEVRRTRDEGLRVAFYGDGPSDAPLDDGREPCECGGTWPDGPAQCLVCGGSGYRSRIDPSSDMGERPPR